jgi:hypothetical protein
MLKTAIVAAVVKMRYVSEPWVQMGWVGVESGDVEELGNGLASTGGFQGNQATRRTRQTGQTHDTYAQVIANTKLIITP